jgi:single-stranded-DNA-specific exonuclease
MPNEIKNLKKVALRILKAIANKEKIILYGDADLDGAASVIILEQAIEDMGGKIKRAYFPDRENEGYGITESALKSLAKIAPALFITLDCGIGNFKEIKIANKMGFEVLIVDHHKILGKLPDASIVVDPRQKSDKYPFKELAAAGVVYKLVKTMLQEAGRWNKPEKFLELAALATLADMMILEADNEKIVKQGISVLNYTKRPGLRALIKLTDCPEQIDVETAKRKIIPLLNSGGPTKNHLNEIYLLLTETNLNKAKKIVKTLIEKNKKRKQEIKKIFREVEERVEISEDSPLVFEGDSSWTLVLLGPVGSRILQKYKKPIFLFKKGKEESPGAVRTPKGCDGVKAMEACKNLLGTFGGHPPAAGFRLKNQNLQKFKKCLTKYFLR